MAAFLAAMPAVAYAQPSIGVNVGVNAGVDAGDDTYDTVAPGDPVESVDVFYDQLEPYGTWVDEPDVGRVFLPEADGYVPYHNGHWQYTNLGFVWNSSEPHAWATAHYGRWAWSNNYNRWYWSPDTEWGPAWVQWRQTGTDFGWAPLPPAVVVRAGWEPPAESWHYCGAEHVLDVNVTRYYEPRTRVIEIHRSARPLEHYSTVSNVRVVVGPPRSVLREHRVEVRPVRVEARTIGRWTPAEAHAQVERAHQRQATFEVANQRRIESNVRIRDAHTKVIEAHPQIKAQVNVRLQAGGRVEAGHPEPGRNEPGRVETRPGQPGHVEPGHEPNRPGEPNRVDLHRPTVPQPGHAAPQPARPEPNRQEPNRPEPNRPEPNRPEPGRQEPNRAAPSRPEPNRVEHNEPRPAPAPQPHNEPHPAPQPQHNEPHPAPQQAQHNEPHPAPAPQPRNEPHPASAPQQSHPAENHPAENHPAENRGGENKGGEHGGNDHREEHH